MPVTGKWPFRPYKYPVAWRGSQDPAIHTTGEKKKRLRQLTLADSHPDVAKFKPTALKLAKQYVPNLVREEESG